jgi:hypothetical protein
MPMKKSAPMKSLRFALALSGLLAISGAAHAQSSRESEHGRGDAVNDRVAHQNERIREQRREHELAAQRAREMHRREHRAPAEEHALDRHENHEIGR